MSLAKVIVSGQVVSDPEKRFTPNNNTVTSFNLAVATVSRGPSASNEPFIVKVTCWRQLAESVAEQLRKGEEVIVEGKLMTNTIQTPEGVQKKTFEIEAASIDRLSGAPQPILAAAGAGGSDYRGGGAPQNRYATPPAAAVSAPAGGGYAEPAASAPMRPQQGGYGGGGFTSDDLLTEDDIPF